MEDKIQRFTVTLEIKTDTNENGHRPVTAEMVDEEIDRCITKSAKHFVIRVCVKNVSEVSR